MPVSNNLSRRERQILEIVYELGEASAKEVEERLPNSPSYSAIRATMNKLEAKKFVAHREQDLKYVYFPIIKHADARSSALQRLLKTFFDGSASQAMSTLLDISKDNISRQELEEMQALIDSARRDKENNKK